MFHESDTHPDAVARLRMLFGTRRELRTTSKPGSYAPKHGLPLASVDETSGCIGSEVIAPSGVKNCHSSSGGLPVGDTSAQSKPLRSAK